ncbi:hypothetical protein CRE_15717 [Caenorhabditis remanei]|uniref:Uncharacterized protein n=1 Tax=Caenorhabditis remanei TaxID=31234 RepID=E3NCB1_CAERE|nr:hypothetical protein CRE_15717 [Caenorhabditis remanei]
MTSKDRRNRDKRLEQMREDCRVLKKIFCLLVTVIVIECILVAAVISCFVYLAMLQWETGKPIPFVCQKWFVYSCLSISVIFLVLILFFIYRIIREQKRRLEGYKAYGIS